MSKTTPKNLYVDGRSFDPIKTKAVFDEFGAVVVKQAIEPEIVNGYTEAIRTLAVSRLNSLGCEASNPNDLDSSGRQLLAAGPEHLSELFQIAREIREQYEFLFSKGMMRATQAVLPAAVVQVVPESCGIRMDAPNEDARGFHWHYDYAYITSSLDGVTGWAPLQQMTEDMGWLRILPGSHRKIHPMNFRDKSTISGHFVGHHVFSLQGPDVDAMERESFDVIDVQPGDLLLLHCCLLHRSGHNRGNHARWTALCRFSNGLDESLVARGWRSVRDTKGERLFLELHPEFVHRAPMPNDVRS